MARGKNAKEKIEGSSCSGAEWAYHRARSLPLVKAVLQGALRENDQKGTGSQAVPNFPGMGMGVAAC